VKRHNEIKRTRGHDGTREHKGKIKTNKITRIIGVRKTQ